MSVCDKDHRYLPEWDSLPESQASANTGGRHICAGCAYVQGLKDGLSNEPAALNLSNLSLPNSQAGTTRHKDAMEAYKLGYMWGERYGQ